MVGAKRLVVGKSTTSKFDLDLRDEAGDVEKARFDMTEEGLGGWAPGRRQEGGVVKLKTRQEGAEGNAGSENMARVAHGFSGADRSAQDQMIGD